MASPLIFVTISWRNKRFCVCFFIVFQICQTLLGWLYLDFVFDVHSFNSTWLSLLRFNLNRLKPSANYQKCWIHGVYLNETHMNINSARSLERFSLNFILCVTSCRNHVKISTFRDLPVILPVYALDCQISNANLR